MVATDERSVRWQGTVRARQHLNLKPEGARIEINPLLSLYNHSLAGVDRHDALVVPQQQVLPEDVLR